VAKAVTSLPARISYCEAYELCLTCRRRSPGLAEQLLYELLATTVPSWAGEPSGLVDRAFWEQMAKPYGGESDFADNEATAYGYGRVLGVEVDNAALRVALGIAETGSPSLPPAKPAPAPPATAGRRTPPWRNELYRRIDNGLLDPALTNADIADQLVTWEGEKKGKRLPELDRDARLKTIQNVLSTDKEFLAWREKS
jgi:hypothetical protein